MPLDFDKDLKVTTLLQIISFRGLLILLHILLVISIIAVLRMFVKKIREYYSSSGEITNRNWDNTPYSMRISHNYLHESINNLEYKQEYELDFANLTINRTEPLGSGKYGSVADGILNISKQWKKTSVFSRFLKSDKTVSVAVKVPRVDEEELKEVALKMLYDELKILCAVGQHPNVVTLVGAVTSRLYTHSELYVVVEKCEHKCLHKFLLNKRYNFHSQNKEANINLSQVDANGYLYPDAIVTNKNSPIVYEQPEMKIFNTKVTTSHLLSYGWQAANGMKHLSAIKCVHRDLAARNILITANGVCKVSDFGMARNIAEKEYYRLRSQYPLPTRWMAPEALEKATIQSDMWSFGILLYEIFTLSGLPYPNIAPEQVIDAVKKGIRNSKPENAHSQIYQFMRSCWDINPENRPSFKDASRLLEDHLNQSSKQFYLNVCQEMEKEWKNQEYLTHLRNVSKAKEIPSNAQDYYFASYKLYKNKEVQIRARNSNDYIPAGTVRQTLSSGSSGQSTSDSLYEGSYTC